MTNRGVKNSRRQDREGSEPGLSHCVSLSSTDAFRHLAPRQRQAPAAR